jgi:ribosome-dependent ATPase
MESVFAIVPGIIALLLALIPTVLTAVGVVREKEMGSITNLYVTPATRLEFLLGKQLPYVCVSLIDFVALVALTIVVFGVPLKGSFLALAVGALLFVTATTGFGLLISAFTKSQIAAIFAALILTMLPSMMFSGMIRPVSSLTGGAAVMGKLFPSAYFHKVSVGAFTKALGFGDLLGNYAALGAFIAAFLVLSLVLLRKQEV